MKRAWILLSALALLLTGCARQDKHPEWDENWTAFGDRMAVEPPRDFALAEFNDALSLNGIWYASWVSGEERTVTNAEGEEASAYAAQLYLLVKECAGEDEATANVHDWIDREAKSYRAGEPFERGVGTQSYSMLLLNAANENNPYSHGAAAFALRGDMAISAELLCAEGFEGDPLTILEQFLNGIHYGE